MYQLIPLLTLLPERHFVANDEGKDLKETRTLNKEIKLE